MRQGFTTTLGQHTVDTEINQLQPSCSTYAVAATNVGELLQLQTTLAIIEHRSASSTSSRSSKSHAQQFDCDNVDP